MDKSTTVVLDLSPLSESQLNRLLENANEMRYQLNEQLNLLLLFFPSAVAKLRFVKRIPKHVWPSGCVVRQYSKHDLERWCRTSLN
jgi:hypothetical protein